MVFSQDQEATEFLGLREQLKESIRVRNRANLSGFPMNVTERTNKLPSDNYGSFFGPSQPTISKRVIEESRVWQKENLDSISRVLMASMNKPSDSLKKQKDFASSRTEMKKKIAQLKMSRDYSFLHEGSAQLPPASDSKAASPQGSEALKSKQALGNNGKQQVKGVSGDAKLPPPPTKVQAVCGKRKRVSLDSVLHSKAGSKNSTPAGKFNSTSMDSKKQINIKTGIEGKPIQTAKSKAVGKKPSGKIPPNPYKEASSDQKQYSKLNLEVKIKLNQAAPSLEPQDNKATKYVSSQAMRQVHRPKKRPLSESEKAIMAVREMFNTKRFANRDDRDDGTMEANFDDIIKEERRSAKLARKEDAEQLRLLEEEERREKLAKKSKLCHKTQQNP